MNRIETGEIVPLLKKEPELEYNLAGGLLLTIREADLFSLDKKLFESGYKYGCVLPFRGLRKTDSIERFKTLPLKIVHLEEAWNPTDHDSLPLAVLAGLYGYWQRRQKIQQNAPILQDALFPSKQTCHRLFSELYQAFPGIKFISHEFRVDYPADRLLVEINQGIELSAKEILDKSQEQGIGLVFDPRHLLPREKMVSFPSEPTKPDLGEWEKQFNEFASRVEVVDINPPQPQDLIDLREGKGLLRELAQAAKEAGNVKFLRVEIPIPPKLQIPGLPSHQKGFEFLQAIGQRLMEK